MIIKKWVNLATALIILSNFLPLDLPYHFSLGVKAASPPTVVTGDAFHISNSSATLTGNLTGLGSASSVNASFQWGTTSDNYTFETPSVAMNTTGAFSADISGLVANTTYYFAAKAAGDGRSYGAEKSFVSGTKAVPQDPAAKISGLLTLQVQAKLQAFATGGASVALSESQQAGLFSALKLPGTNLRDLERQRVFIDFAGEPSQSEIDDMASMGIVAYRDSWIPPVSDHQTGFLTADMPVKQLAALAGRSYVFGIDTAERLLYPQNDLATKEMGVPAVWNSGYNGAGVRIAVLDSGLDLTHPDIPAPVASKDYSNYPILDDTIADMGPGGGHGTHVTASALGRGTASGGAYKGSAPAADLIFLKVGKDTNGRTTPDILVRAIKDAVDVYDADIITISYNTRHAFHDGSSQESRAVDYAFSEGAVVFVAAGNDAGEALHYSGTVEAGSTTDYIRFDVSGGTSNALVLFTMVWYDGIGTRNHLEMSYYDSAFSPLLSEASESLESERGTEAQMSHLSYTVPPGVYYVRVTNTSASGQLFHIYATDPRESDVNAGRVMFQNADPYYTIGSPGDSDSAITVGAYVTRRAWTNYQGNPFNFGQTAGNISGSSGRGPRVDTVGLKPSIVAPGSAIISARDKNALPFSSQNDPAIINNDYFVREGTSMAAPLAAGVAALLVQKYPYSTPTQIKNTLQSTATDKGVAGPDPTFGYGLVNAQTAMAAGPTVVSGVVSDITASSTKFYGTLISLGNASSVEVSLMYGFSSTDYTYETPVKVMNSEGDFSVILTDLLPNTTYHFKAKAFGSLTATSGDMTFTTSSIETPPPFVYQWGSYGSGPGQFIWAAGVVADPAGNVYVGDMETHRIQKFTESGAFITQWSGFYNNASLWHDFGYPGSLAADAVGNIYVGGLCFNAPTGYYVVDYVSPTYPGTVFKQVEGSPHKFTSDGLYLGSPLIGYDPTDGNKYPYLPVDGGVLAVDQTGIVYTGGGAVNSGIIRLTPDMQAWGPGWHAIFPLWNSSLDDNLYEGAYKAAVDLSGNVYVLDGSNGRIKKFNKDFAFISKWGTPPGDGNLHDARDVVLDAAGNVYVAAGTEIKKFSSDGGLLTRWTTNTTKMNGSPADAISVAIGPQGNIYVVVRDGWNSRVEVYGPPIHPNVETTAVNYVKTTSARLNGILTSLGSASSAQVSFQWGTTPDPDNLNQGTVPEIRLAEGTFSASISGLSPKTTYYYRARASGDGDGYGNVYSFRTKDYDPPPPQPIPPKQVTEDAWETVRNPSNLLSDVALIGSDHGWASTSNGTVLHTSDGGTTWSAQYTGTGSEIWAVSFVSSTEGWAVGAGGAIVHTSNGGNTWTARSSGTSFSLYGVSFVDANNGWAVGAGGKILRTSNGGGTWINQNSGTTNSLYAVRFVSTSDGWAVGSSGAILRTSNGGSTWALQTSGTTSSLLGVDFVGADNGWAVGSGVILHTSNGGIAWTTQNSTTTFLSDVDFVDTINGWAAGRGGTVLRTSDGGATWVVQPSNTTMNLMGISFIDGSRGWAVGESMARLYTSDGGANWAVRYREPSRSYLSSAVDVSTPLEGWAVPSGVPLGKGWTTATSILLYTKDRGTTWAEKNTGIPASLFAVDFTDSKNGWVVGSGGTILHTANGGTTWTSQSSTTANTLRGVRFVDTRRGWSVGQGGIIVHTSDGGSTWAVQTSGTANYLYAVSFVNENHGWAVGQGGTILHTTNGGATWAMQTSGTANYLYAVSFVNENHGWAVGQSGTILHTTNGGNTWAVQSGVTNTHLYGVSFVNLNEGWIVGQIGTILHTLNGGANWIAQASGTTTRLSGINAIDSGHAWATGDYGTILRYKPAVLAPPGSRGAWGTNSGGQASYPSSVAADASGNIYVVDTANHTVQKFTTSGTLLTKWGSFGSGNGEFMSPSAVAVDDLGNVYVADTMNQRIQKFTSSGAFITKWGSAGPGDGQFRSPSGIVVDTSGNIYVSDNVNNRIQKFTSSGDFITKWGSFWTRDGQFDAPAGIAVDASGDVYVADAKNARIQKFTSSGIFIDKWVSLDADDGQFVQPAAIAVDGFGNVLVVDRGSGRILEFTSEGEYISGWGSAGSGDGQFVSPSGIAVDALGNIYVADAGNARIQVFSVAVQSVVPQVVTSFADQITAISARLNGKLTSTGTSATANVSFLWGTGLDIAESPKESMNVTGDFTQVLTGLSANTTYWFQAKAVGDGTAYGANVTFMTPLLSTLPAPPNVTTNGVDNVTSASARLIGSLTSLGTANSVNISFQWGASLGTYDSETPLQLMTSAGNFTAFLPALSANTTYYFRSKAVGDGTSYGNEQSFTTTSVQPGDANGDGVVNALDITKVERIITHIDQSTPGADANQDGDVNALDITKVERLIVGLH